MSEVPDLGVVPPQRNVELSAVVYAEHGVLASAEQLCVRFGAYLYQ